MQPTVNLDVSKLYGNLVFHSDSPHEVRSELSAALNEHELSLGKGSINTKLFECRLKQISIMKLTYGAEVDIRAMPFDGFSLVQTPLQGLFDVETNGCRRSFRPGDVAVLSPHNDIGIHWQQGSEQLIVKIPHHLLQQHTNDGTGANVFHSPAYRLDPSLSMLWCSMIQQALDLSDNTGTRLNSTWLEHFERSMALFLATHQNDAQTDAEPAAEASSGNTRASVAALERMEAYIHQRLCAPISLVDLANAAGLSPRSLNALCHKYHGISPMVLLRNVRLDAVRRKLRTCPDANVTTIALDHGFGHLGRFSAYYRERFGELPRDTAAARQFLPCL